MEGRYYSVQDSKCDSGIIDQVVLDVIKQYLFNVLPHTPWLNIDIDMAGKDTTSLLSINVIFTQFKEVWGR